MDKKFLESKWTPFVIAFIVGLFATVYYMTTGQGSLDLKKRELIKDSQVAEVDLSNKQRVNITCTNGEKYEIVFTEDHQNYDELIFDSCGAQGGTVNLSDTSSPPDGGMISDTEASL